MNDEPIQSFAHLDLTGETRGRTHVVGEVQHILFHRFGRADLGRPGVVDIDMTGRAGAGPAAFRFDPGTELRTAFSMTVEPFSTSSSWRAPSKATIVSFVISLSGTN